MNSISQNPLLNALGQPVGHPVDHWTPRPLPPRSPIIGRHCILEPLDASLHAADLHAANSLDVESRNWTYLPYGPFDSAGAYRAWVESVADRPDPMFFAIRPTTLGTAAGVASLMRIDMANGVIEIGHINFSPLLQRTPAATEAIYLMMRVSFELGYRRCEWKCDALNRPSRNAAQRFGFSYEGIFRQAVIYRSRNRDTAWYACIDSEWADLDAAFTTWLDPENFDAEGRQKSRLSDLTDPILKCRG